MTAWSLLVVAGAFECAWVVGLKYARGFTRLWPSVFTVLALAVSMILLARAAQKLPIGTAYAVWTGIGAVGAALLGMLLFGESCEPLRLVFIGLVIAGTVGLAAMTPH